MHLHLKDKKALVLGSSSGIGYAIAKSFADEGVRVALCARHEDRLKKAAESIGTSYWKCCDLSLPSAGRNLAQAMLKEMDGIDILVTNTGGPPAGPFTEISSEKWQIGFQSLWMSTVDTIQSVLPYMKQNKWGRIILITSLAAKEPITNLTVSNGLRAGLLGLMKSISHEIGRYGITINALLPGYTRTERLSELQIDEAEIISQIPVGRLGEPSELAALATFLSSTQAAFITGQAIACDGGQSRSI